VGKAKNTTAKSDSSKRKRTPEEAERDEGGVGSVGKPGHAGARRWARGKTERDQVPTWRTAKEAEGPGQSAPCAEEAAEKTREEGSALGR